MVADDVSIHFKTEADSIADTEVDRYTGLTEGTKSRAAPKVAEVLAVGGIIGAIGSRNRLVDSSGFVIVETYVKANTGENANINQTIGIEARDEIRQIERSVDRRSNILLLPRPNRTVQIVACISALALPCVNSQTETYNRIEVVAGLNLCIGREEINEVGLAKRILAADLRTNVPVAGTR